MTPTAISDISELGGWVGIIFRQTAAISADEGSRMLRKGTDKVIDSWRNCLGRVRLDKAGSEVIHEVSSLSPRGCSAGAGMQ